MNSNQDRTTRSELNFMTATGGGSRRVAIPVDLSDESGHAVRWAVQNYLREGDSVVLLHVRPMSVLYGTDWGSIKLQITGGGNNSRNMVSSRDGDGTSPIELRTRSEEEEYDRFAEEKARWLGAALEEAGVPYVVHIVKDHDLKQRLCLEVERLGLSAVIIGSKGFGYSRRLSGGSRGKRRLGSVSDYCVRHSICPVVVVRNPEEDDEEEDDKDDENAVVDGTIDKKKELYPVREEEVPEVDEEEE